MHCVGNILSQVTDYDCLSQTDFTYNLCIEHAYANREHTTNNAITC